MFCFLLQTLDHPVKISFLGIVSAHPYNPILLVASDIEVTSSGQVQSSQVTLLGSLKQNGDWHVERLRLLNDKPRTLEGDVTSDLELFSNVLFSNTDVSVTGSLISNGHTITLPADGEFVALGNFN